MTPAEFIKKRSGDWKELTRLLDLMEYKMERSLAAKDILKFARLYRSACTDLSLAAAFRLPRESQEYLHALVSRGHDTLYSVRRNRAGDIKDFFLRRIPALVYKDVYIRICLLAFFVPFLVCMFMAYNSKSFSALVLGEARMQQYYEMHSKPPSGTSMGRSTYATSFYISNNVGIDLLIFGMGILGGVGSLFLTLFNAVFLGTVLGYLFSTPARDNILTWIMAHGPFELTAICFAAGAGLRIGYAFVAPGGRERMRALLEEARGAVPIITAAGLLTFSAAFLEAFIGPSKISLEYRMIVAAACAVFMIMYFGVTGWWLNRMGYDPMKGIVGFKKIARSREEVEDESSTPGFGEAPSMPVLAAADSADAGATTPQNESNKMPKSGDGPAEPR